MRPRAFCIDGVLRSAECGKPLGRLLVRAWDRDLVFDDDLGRAWSDGQGRFRIEFDAARFRDLVEARPDVYLKVFDETGRIQLASTAARVRRNARTHEFFVVEIPRRELARLPRPLPAADGPTARSA